MQFTGPSANMASMTLALELNDGLPCLLDDPQQADC
jgi:hypothetical protein